ncbi:MAG TPA: HEPN domain-containing protein [Longimicrobiales bacterium]|nr:HEPN domain-containing protein [Longimicrobiales bacterium]
MQNRDLARDHVWRSEIRLRALAVLYDAESWADVVRESQEIVELVLKGLLRSCGVAPPRVHDLSEVLLAERDRLPPLLEEHLDRMVAVSRRLRRDRELAFYGAEDLTPSGFYTVEDADRARADAEALVALIAPHV